jgi:hypothetical protein
MITHPADTPTHPEPQQHRPTTPRSGRTDALLLVLTGVFVGGLALVAGSISFAHMTALAAAHGQAGWKSGAFPVSVDGLELVASLYILARHRAGRPTGALPWAALLVGTGASLAANIAVGGADPVGRALAGWPAVSLLVSVKLLFSRFDHATQDHRTVRDDQRTVPDGPPADGTVPDGSSAPGIVPDGVPDDTGSSRTTSGRGSSATGPAGNDTGSAAGTPGDAPTAPVAGRGGAATDVGDVADLIPAARAARVALTGAGRRLTRDALADRMRDAGHGLSNARACLLVRVLRAEEAVATLDPARGERLA